jgi:hypothetical protein
MFLFKHTLLSFHIDETGWLRRGLVSSWFLISKVQGFSQNANIFITIVHLHCYPFHAVVVLNLALAPSWV